MRGTKAEHSRLSGDDDRLIEVSLFSDGAYYFVYEKGEVFRIFKIDLKIEEPRKV